MPKMLFILCFALFWSCGDTKVVDAPIPKPLKVYEKDDIKLASYDFDGLQHFLNRENDTLYIVNFWATWCKPCVEELPYFQEFYEKNKEQPIQMYLVNLDFPKMVETGVLSFIQKNNLTPPVLHLNDPDANRWIPLVDENWSGAIPATVIYKGNKRAFHETSFTLTTLEEAVAKVLKKS